MKAIFCSKPGIASWLIRVACWSRWSHVAIIEDDEHVIHSTFWGGGVHRTTIWQMLGDYTEIEFTDIPVPDEVAAMAFLRDQLGKPYDWTAIVGMVMRRDWAEVDSWFCSELLEACLRAGGLTRFRALLSRITQQHQWMLEPPKVTA